MHGQMALGGIQQLAMHRGHRYYGSWLRGHVCGSFWILPQTLVVVWEIMPLHPNISRQCNLSCKSIKDDRRRECAALKFLIPEAKNPELNIRPFCCWLWVQFGSTCLPKTVPCAQGFFAVLGIPFLFVFLLLQSNKKFINLVYIEVWDQTCHLCFNINDQFHPLQYGHCVFTGNHPFEIKLRLKKWGIFNSCHHPKTLWSCFLCSVFFFLISLPVRKSLEACRLLCSIWGLLGRDAGWVLFMHWQ